MLKRTFVMVVAVCLVSVGGIPPAALSDEEGVAPPEKKEGVTPGSPSGGAERKMALALAITALITLALLGAFWKLASGYDPRVTTFYRLLGDEAEAHYQRGRELHAQGNRGRAIAEYRRAIFINRSHWAAHQSLGYALMESGDREGAVRELRLCLDRPDLEEAERQAVRDAILRLGGTP